MKVFFKDLISGQAQEITHSDGHVNSVLCKFKAGPPGASNWIVSNTVYYNLHLYLFEGYVELES